MRALAFAIAFASSMATAVEVPCDDVPRIEAALAQALAPEVRASTSIQRASCSVQLSDWVSEPIRRLTKKDHPVDGLNCWGSAMFLRGLRPVLFYGNDREFTFVMNHACTAVDRPQAGDIGAIRRKVPNGGFEELHAFVYLTPDYAISKHSYSYESRLEITMPEKFFSAYGREVTYFRCAGWNTPELPAGLRILMSRLQQDYLENRPVQSPRAEAFYGPLLKYLNHYYFETHAGELDYGFSLFESAIWQYAYLYSSVRTRQGEISL